MPGYRVLSLSLFFFPSFLDDVGQVSSETFESGSLSRLDKKFRKAYRKYIQEAFDGW